MKELFEHVLTAGFYGSIVILAVMLLRLVLKKTPKKVFRVLWLLAFLRLLMPFEIDSPLSLQPDTEAIAQQPWVQQVEILPDPLGGFYPEYHSQPVDTPQPVNSHIPARSVPVENTPAPTVQPDSPAKAEIDPATVVSLVWLGVGVAILLYSLFTYLRLRFQVREAIKIPGGWECEGIQTAFILGYFRPRVYIPMGMSLASKSYILAHERTHLRRGDHWFKLLGYIALAVHWYNPLVWIAYVLYCKDIELACDEEVVRFMDLEERKHYSAALLKCSASHAHFAACPVAFGEVSVKTRIRSVLNYRKPGFWITLCGVAAIVFVAVCLMTSPVKEEDPPAVSGTEPTTAATAPQLEEKGFASNLSESDIADACQQAIEELLGRETFCVQAHSGGETNSEMSTIASATSVLRQAGTSILKLTYSDETGNLDFGFYVSDGKNASWWGDAWVEDDYPGVSARDSLDTYSPEGKTVTFPEGTGVLSPNSAAYAAQWSQNERDYSGIFTYTFHSDGTLSSIAAEYSYQREDGVEFRYTNTVKVTEEDPADTYKEIQASVGEIYTEEELKILRANRDRVTEVPSNNRQYDKDYLLGSAQMGWKFLDGGWFFKFGAEDATPTGLKLVVEVSGVYENDNVSSATVSPEGNYFLETLKDGVWTTVSPKAEGALPSRVLGTGSTMTVDWTGTYGTLAPGYYRIGSYYTATSSDGAADSQVCYAKFRLMDPNADALMIQCREAIQNLLNSDSYHLRITEWYDLLRSNPNHHVSSSEIWKSGKDYLEAYESRSSEDGSLMGSGGLLWRNGVKYNLTWKDSGTPGEVADWVVNTYVDEVNYQLWSSSFELFDGKPYDITRQGNDILVVNTDTSLSNYGLSRSEILFSFYPDGRFAGAVKTNIREDGEVSVDAQVEVLDTSTEEIRRQLDAPDVSVPGAFSWEADQAAYPEGTEGVRTGDFRNTSPVTVATPLDAINRAIRDCNLPPDGGDDPGTNMFRAFYDESAKMWKVEFTASWDDRIYQAVYMTSEGVTVRTVTLELEADY